MKIQELRNLIKDADRELLEKAFAESYKQFTKHQKEEVDQIINDVLAGRDTKNSKKEEVLDFQSLQMQITAFLDNAYAQNYFAPNRVIPKSQRPKWRFMVKNYNDPFRSIGWEQQDLFQLVVKKNFGLGYPREKISELLLYAASGGLSRESLYIVQELSPSC